MYSGDWRPSLLAVGMLVLYGVTLAVPFARAFFGLALLPVADMAIITGVVVAWALMLRLAWRRWLFERLLGLGRDGSGPGLGGRFAAGWLRQDV